MGYYRFPLEKVFAIGVDDTFVIGEYNMLSIMADCKGADCSLVLAQDGYFLFFSGDVPGFEVPALIAREEVILVWMDDGAGYWSVLFHGFYYYFTSEVEDFK